MQAQQDRVLELELLGIGVQVKRPWISMFTYFILVATQIWDLLPSIPIRYYLFKVHDWVGFGHPLGTIQDENLSFSKDLIEYEKLSLVAFAEKTDSHLDL